MPALAPSRITASALIILSLGLIHFLITFRAIVVATALYVVGLVVGSA